MHFNVPLPPNPMEELEQNRQAAEAEQLTKQERRQLKKQRKREERHEEWRGEQRRRMIKKVLLIVIVGVGVIALGWFITSRPNLPPIITANHIESSPSAHILTRSIPDRIQRHMLEHADGAGAPGIIIQYNCEDFECEPDLVEKLTELVQQYPANVYLAPNKYDGRIILTRLGTREILDEFNERTIRSFIGR